MTRNKGLMVFRALATRYLDQVVDALIQLLILAKLLREESNLVDESQEFAVAIRGL